MSAREDPLRCDREGHCVTCSDEAVAMRVVDPLGDAGIALCADARGRRVEVLTGLVGPVAPGDSLLVHAGAALVRLDPATGSTP